MEYKVTARWQDGKPHLTDGRTLESLNPKELLLCSAAMCACYTLAAILDKSRVRTNNLEITVSGELDTETLQAHSTYKAFNVFYDIECRAEGDEAKIGNAIRLTDEQHCGLIRMLRKIAPVKHTISIVDTEPVDA